MSSLNAHGVTGDLTNPVICSPILAQASAAGIGQTFLTQDTRANEAMTSQAAKRKAAEKDNPTAGVVTEAIRLFRSHLREEKVTFPCRGQPAPLLEAWSDLDPLESQVYFLAARGVVPRSHAKLPNAVSSSPLDRYFKPLPDVGDTARELWAPTEAGGDTDREDVYGKPGNTPEEVPTSPIQSEGEAPSSQLPDFDNFPEDYGGESEHASEKSATYELTEEDLEWLNRAEIRQTICEQEPQVAVPVKSKARVNDDLPRHGRAAKRASNQGGGGRPQSPMVGLAGRSTKVRTTTTIVDRHAKPSRLAWMNPVGDAASGAPRAQTRGPNKTSTKYKQRSNPSRKPACCLRVDSDLPRPGRGHLSPYPPRSRPVEAQSSPSKVEQRNISRTTTSSSVSKQAVT